MPLGELAALGTSLCFSFGSVMFTLSGRMVGSAVVNRTRLLAALLLVSAWHFLTFGQWLPADAAAQSWFWLGLSGFVGLALGDAFLFQAFVMIGPRLSTLMMALAPALAALLAWLFLGETLGLLELLGMAVTLAGVLLVILDRSAPSADLQDRRRLLLGLLFGLGGAVGQAGGLVLSKLGLVDGFQALSGNLIRLLVATTIIWLVTLLQGQVVANARALRAQPRALLLLLGGAVLGPMLGVWLSLVAVQNTQVGIASTLSSLMPIFLIPISAVVFHERVGWQAIGGTLLAFVGMVILFL